VLRLADLLAEEAFALELLSGGDDAGAREVKGAHAVEVEAPARWLGRDWVLPDVAYGFGRPVMAIVDAHHSLRDAELAVDRGVLRFEDFDLPTFMVSEIPAERLAPKVDEILSVLRANPPLHEAVSAYFGHDLDVAATAASLHMHRNSLRYRLARAEQLLGLSLKRPATVAAVYIALVADAGAQRPGGSLDGPRLPGRAAAP
jgi:hypothetical protein